MTPPRARKGAEPAKAPLIQDRPAAPAQKRPVAPVLDPENRDGEFPPNPVPVPRAGRPVASVRHLRVVGPKPMGPDGVRAPGWLTLELTDSQLDALLAGGHVEDWDGVEGWGADGTPDAHTEAAAPVADADGPKDEPVSGAEKEGN